MKAEIAEFDNVVEKLEEEYRASHIGKGTAAAGVAVGAGVAAFAPTAALAVATTFGTASTGTAIATIRASPACQRRFYSFCLLVSKIKGRDCGTINGHDKSLSIRALMKDAREVLVR
ncbi:hypothetical protein [Escherichia coli]|uniref:hypothetical protein n=1 Tax=Escherichia coli TaxID=562 RepID=UPI0021153977|nr:hypothetical protein [Escherichia coli]MCQ7031718.1 hypothetical protein [Escherichia coli]